MEDKYSYQVLFFQTEGGSCPAEDFLSTLPFKVRAKISAWIGKLEDYGPDLPRPYADIVRGKIRELRIIFASRQYRLLYFFYGSQIVITHGFVKKSEKVPDNEMDRADNLRKDFESRIRKGDIKLCEE